MKNLITLSLICISLLAEAIQPPTKEEIKQYKRQGVTTQLAKKARALGNHQISPTLVIALQRKTNTPLSQLNTSQTNGLNGDLQSIGSPKILVLLVEFPDHLHDENFNQTFYQENIFGNGRVEYLPNDSLTNFYKRSSYNQLNLGGSVLNWYKHEQSRPIDSGNNSSDVTQSIIRSAITYHDEKGHDFSQYDNNGDGYIDYVAVLWTGPLGAWASLWWGSFHGYFGDEAFEVDGKKINSFSWQQAYRFNGGENGFNPYTLIHETGHALGLPDYYDYNFEDGGLGNTDVMDGGWVDHNAFSKYALGWLTPTIVSNGEVDIDIYSTATNEDAVLAMPDASHETMFSEYFIAQYRTSVDNDVELANEGLYIYHVDASMNSGGGFENDNSYSDNKLIKLVQADGLNEIENGSFDADANDIFTSGSQFTPNSRVSSIDNQGKQTGVAITNITIDQGLTSLTASILPNIPNFSIDQLIHHQVMRSGVSFTITPEREDIQSVELYVNDVLNKRLITAPYSFNWQSNLTQYGAINFKVKVSTDAGGSSSLFYPVFNMPDSKGVLSVSLSNHPFDSNEKVLQLMHRAGFVVTQSDFLFDISPEDFQMVLVNYGSGSGLWELNSDEGSLSATAIIDPPTNREIDIIKSYLNNGGNLIVEGERIFLDSEYKPSSDFNQIIGLVVDTEKAVSLNQIIDRNGEVVSHELSFPIGEGFELQPDLNPIDSNDTAISSTEILYSSGEYYNFDTQTWLEFQAPCSILNDFGNFKVVATSCLYRHLTIEGTTKTFNKYFELFGFDERLSSEKFVTSKDISGDGMADVLWRNKINGQSWIWTMDGASINEINKVNQITLDWEIAGQGDFDGDSKSDILWRNKKTGRNWIYLMDGASISTSKELNYITDQNWLIVGVDDINKDGKDDILWHHRTKGYTWAYLMDGTTITQSTGIKTVADTNWQVVATGDVNGDGYSDVIWRHQEKGWNYIWLMQGSKISKQYMLNTISTDWQIVGAGDLDGDNTDDIVWRNTTDGRNWVYLMLDGKIRLSKQMNTISDLQWTIKSLVDFDGDGKDDIFWFHEETAQTYIYLMNGLSIKYRSFSNTLSDHWQVVGG